MNFSIITSCFNSTKTLRRTYENLLSLGRNDFEWILIDDFSTDGGGTRELITLIANEAPFPVKYKLLDRNFFGARSAYEASLMAVGKYSCILDHDDEITDDALSIVLNHAINLNKPTIAGIAGRCVDRQGALIGNLFPKNFYVGREGVVRFKWGMTAETFQFTKTNIIRDYFRDLQPGYTNGYAWAKISKDYDFIFVNDIFRVYDTNLITSYSNTKKMHVYYPDAKSVALQETLGFYNDYLIWNFIFSVKLAASSIRHRLNAKMELLSNLPLGVWAKFFYVISIPLGWLKYKKII